MPLTLAHLPKGRKGQSHFRCAKIGTVLEIAAMCLAEQLFDLLLDMILAAGQSLFDQRIDRLQERDVQGEIGLGDAAALGLVGLEMEVAQADFRTGCLLGDAAAGDSRTIRQRAV